MYSTTVCAATGYTPFELVYGFQLTLHETPNPQYECDDYVIELKGSLQTAHEISKQKLIAAQEKSSAKEI
jgi:hypothetical protein